MNEVGLAVSPFLTTHVHRVGLKPAPSLMCPPGVHIRVCFVFFLHADKSRVMPIRRAAATPSQEKPPSAAAEKG